MIATSTLMLSDDGVIMYVYAPVIALMIFILFRLFTTIAKW